MSQDEFFEKYLASSGNIDQTYYSKENVNLINSLQNQYVSDNAWKRAYKDLRENRMMNEADVQRDMLGNGFGRSKEIGNFNDTELKKQTNYPNITKHFMVKIQKKQSNY